MKDELKKCPFCGGSASWWYREPDDKPIYHWVECDICGAKIHWSSDKGTAVARWNNRAEEQPK